MNKLYIIVIVLLSLYNNVYSQNWELVEQYHFNNTYDYHDDWNPHGASGYVDCNTGAWKTDNLKHGTYEEQFWSDETDNIRYENIDGENCLILAAEYEPNFFNCDWRDYKSGIISSKKVYRYGKFEIRCKIPRGEGLFPSFWLWGVKNSDGHEFDIFEFMDNKLPELNSEVHMTYHRYPAISPHYSSSSIKYFDGVDFADDFHTFSAEWTSDYIKWYIDDVPVRILYNNNDPEQHYPDADMHIIANVAVQDFNYGLTNWTQAYMAIDYIKVYKETSCKSYIITNNETATSYSGYNIDLAVDDSDSDDGYSYWPFSKVLSSNESLSVTAENKITMRCGFVAEEGSHFIGKIEPCLMLKSSILNQKALITDDQLGITTEITIYPNPNNGQFTIRKGEQEISSIRVTNISGEVIVHIEGTNISPEVDIGSYPPGIYLIVVVCNGKSVHQKIIKS